MVLLIVEHEDPFKNHFNRAFIKNGHNPAKEQGDAMLKDKTGGTNWINYEIVEVDLVCFENLELTTERR